MAEEKPWGECVIHQGTPSVAVHWCRPYRLHIYSGMVPTMWPFCQRCHELTIRRRWSLLVTHAVDETRKRLPQIDRIAQIEPAMLIVAFMVGRTGAWTHRDGSKGAVAAPETTARWLDATIWRREGP
jgi:hypothetical protein